MTISSSNPIHSIFWMVVVFLHSAGFLIILGFEFLSLMIIIIYIGAIAILFLFVIMMLDIIQLKKLSNINNIIPLLFIMSILVITQSWWFFKYNNINFSQELMRWNVESLDHISNLASVLYTEFAYPFILISILLLVAMIGAIVLTLELGIITRKQNLSTQHHRNNSWT